jgi:propanol-preferring alcohol dehydrogenase
MQGVTVYRAIKHSDTHIGDWIVVPGAGGGLGHLGDFPNFYDGFRPCIDNLSVKSYSIRVSDGSSCGSYWYERLGSPSRAPESDMVVDSGAEKKKLCLQLGAEKWIDFKESRNLVNDVKDACDGLGPHCALVTAATVCLSI